MRLDQINPPYFDGRNVDQITARIRENEKRCHTVVIKPEIQKGELVQLRYPHPLDEQWLTVSANL